MFRVRMIRGLAVGLMGLFLVSLLGGLVPLPIPVVENASATTTSTFYLNISGYYSHGGLERWGMTYPPVDGETINSAELTTQYLQHMLSGGGLYTTERQYLGFDTSSMGDSVEVVSATLFIRTKSTVVAGSWACEVYQSAYTTLDLGDWDEYSAFQGTLLDGTTVTTDTWYSISVQPASINKTGESQFMLKVDEDPLITPTSIQGCGFATNYSAAYPYVVVTFGLKQVSYWMELSTGAWVNGSAFPDVQSWNLTHDLYTYEIDTVPNAYNLTIEKDTDWTLGDFAPFGNYTLSTDSVLMNDVWDSICYRIWFLVPNGQPTSFLHVSAYNAFTGEGMMFESVHIRYSTGSSWNETSGQDVTSPDLYLYPYQNYTFRIEDFFGNVLVDYVYMPNAQVNYLAIPVPAYSWQIFNMNDAPVLMSIYWNNSGSPWQFFVGPHWIIERFLKGGDYTFMVTFYNTDGTAGETVYFNRTVPMTGLNASFVYVNGTTLYEIISTVEGVMATQEIITNLVSPNIILIYEDLPMAPAKLRTLSLSSSLALDPYLILEATTYQNSTGVAGINSTLWTPHPSVVGATYYILSDTLSFSGTHATTLYINQTDGTNLLTSATLPATFLLNGQNITVWGDVAYSVSRATVWREITEYTVNYYSTQKKYEATLSLNNSCSFDFYAPYWFIGFPNLTAIDPDSVTLYDLDNGLYLSQRTNFEVSSGGVHLTLVQLNASAQRNFRITYFDENSTTGIGAPNLMAEGYTVESLNGVPMKYTAVQWTNPWSVEYRGEVYITLNFTGGDNLLASSISVIDETTGTNIPNSNWIYTGRTIIILTDGVGSVPVGGARNYGIYFTFGSTGDVTEKVDFFFGPIVFQGKHWYIGSFAISWFLIVVILAWAVVGWRWWNDRPDATSLLIMVAAVTVVGFYMSGFMT